MSTGTVEAWARSIICAELGVPVEVHDDGSEPGMYDLRIGPKNDPDVAIECVGAVDPVSTETWNVGPARGPVTAALSGDWTVEIRSGARFRRITQELGALLHHLEREGIDDLRVDLWLRHSDQLLYDLFDDLGVTHAHRHRQQGKGKVSFTMPGRGGAVDTVGASVPIWVSSFLTDRTRADVLSKLALSGATRTEVFIAVTLDGTPWSVVSYLTGDVTVVPTAAPELPTAVAGVWVCPTHGTKGVYWDGSDWRAVTSRP